MKTNKSFQAPSAKPVDVEYRLKRLNEVLGQAGMFLAAIDPSVAPEAHESATQLLEELIANVALVKPPAKKARKTAQEKAAEILAKEAERVAKAEAKAAAKAAKTKKKATDDDDIEREAIQAEGEE